MKSSEINYFPNLNSIRAIAAFVVMIAHIDQELPLFGLSSIGYHDRGTATYGVVLFFVLSGFLITYLLLKEKERKVKIDFPKFYLRRILRIWPVYYIAIIVSIVLIFINLIPITDTTWDTILFYSLFLSNLGYTLGYSIVTITPLWSVGVEEQFYLFWPWLIEYSKNIMNVIFFFFFFIILKVSFRLLGWESSYMFLINSSFSCMSVGAMGAFIYTQYPNLLDFIYNKFLQLGCFSLFFISLFWQPFHIASIFDAEIHALIYLVVILNLATNKSVVISLENQLLRFLGSISYGIYVYHLLVIYILSLIFKVLLVKYSVEPTLLMWSLFLLIPSLSVLVSYLSFQYIENYFLKLKNKYSIFS